MCLIILKHFIKEEQKGLKNMVYKTQEFFNLWWLKALIGSGLAFITGVGNWFVGELGVNVPLFYLFCGLFLADFCLGWLVSYKKHKYSKPQFAEILLKFLRYTYYIVLVIIASLILKWSTGIGYTEVFNGFIGFMAANELASLARHSDQLGIPLHPLVKSIVYALPNRLKKDIQYNINPEEVEQEEQQDKNLDIIIKEKE